MTTKSPKKQPAHRGGSGSESVEDFLADLEHPRKREILAIREILLGADPTIAEGIKWNAPSFRTSEYFATFHLRAKDGVQLILHLGAKKREEGVEASAISDPASLLKWLGKDRASVTLRDLDEIEQRRSALTEIVRQWIRYV